MKRVRFHKRAAVRILVAILYTLWCPAPVTWAGSSDMIETVLAEKDDAFRGDEKPLPSGRITNALGMTFSYIPPGEFNMGSPSDEAGRKTNEIPHNVIITRGFYMMTTEVTQKQWQAVMGSNPSVFDRCGARCPVENVSWRMVKQFIKKMNNREAPKIPAEEKTKPIVKTNINTDINTDTKTKPTNVAAQWRYALPTEAQWEYACRAGSRGWFHFRGDSWRLSEYGWYKSNSGGQPHEVALKKPNPFELYDMHGNVWEWCRDFSGVYPAKPATDPTGPRQGRFRIVRGGSWYYPALAARCANRLSLPPGMGNYNVGFRLVLVEKK